MFLATWCGMVGVACVGDTYGQSESANVRLRVPARVLASAAVPEQMVNFSGFVSSGTQADPLSYYQRSRLGKWKVARDVDSEDSVFGVELETPAGLIRIRYEISVDDQPFRTSREKTIDELLAIAKGDVADAEDAEEASEGDVQEVHVEASAVEADPVSDLDADGEPAADAKAESEPELTAPETYTSSSGRDRMVAYAQSRGDRLTRYELRRRVADAMGGPALLWTSGDFGSERNETLSLFAFLDADEDGVISKQEREASGQALNDRDVNADGRVEWNELQSGLKTRSARRATDVTLLDWRSWDASTSEYVEDVSVMISFGGDDSDSNLTIDDCGLGEPWRQTTAELQQAFSQESHGQAILLSHPRAAVALTVVQPADLVDVDQISVGVTSESNALFRQLDRDGDWILSGVERRSCAELIAALDQNADGSLEVSELPILLRVCVARGAVAHEALSDGVSVIQSLSDADEHERNLVPPQWFVSMDKDGDRTLTRKEFVGGRAPFDLMDTDDNDLLSVEEALAVKTD